MLQGRMGDICCGLPAYRALRNKYRHDHIAWQVAKMYQEIIPDDVDERIYTGGSAGERKPRSEGFDISIRAQPMFRHKDWEKSGKHIIDLIAKWSGVKLRDRKITIKVPKDIKQGIFVHKFIRRTPRFATICSSPCYSCKDWEINTRRQIVRELRRKGVHVATVGGKDGVDLGASASFHGKLTILETVEVIAQSQVYIGPDNGTSWLACAAEKTYKIMMMDKSRLQKGVTGFQRYVDGSNIKDVFYKAQGPKQLAAAMASRIL